MLKTSNIQKEKFKHIEDEGYIMRKELETKVLTLKRFVFILKVHFELQ